MNKLKNFLKNERAYKTLLYGAFACFIIGLVWFIIFKAGNNNSINKMFNGKMGTYSLKKRFNEGLKSTFIKGRIVSIYQLRDAMLNVLAFVPFGIYLPLIFKKHKAFKCLLVASLTTLFFEAFQLFSIWGCFAVDDLVANIFGSVIGLIFYFVLVKRFKPQHLTAINLLLVVIVAPICFYAIFGIFKDFNFYRELIIALPTKY